MKAGPRFSRPIPAEREGSVEIDAETAKETRVGANPDRNR